MILRWVLPPAVRRLTYARVRWQLAQPADSNEVKRPVGLAVAAVVEAVAVVVVPSSRMPRRSPGPRFHAGAEALALPVCDVAPVGRE
jgi:hypothetical protein